MKKLLMVVMVGLILCVLPVGAMYQDPNAKVVVNTNITISSILTQVQWMTQQQSQIQEQHVSVASGTSWISGVDVGNNHLGGIVQYTQTYSRLVYPNEVLTFPVVNGSTCKVLAGLPVGFYTVGAGHSYHQNEVQTLEAVPTYDSVFHKMEFGYVPVVDKIDYWTMKAKLLVTGDAAFCVVDNRAPMNDYTTIEVTIE